MALLAIARRRGLLCDTLLLALVDSSWEILDISGSEVTDKGMLKVAETCLCLKAVDISRCNQLSPRSIGALLQKCESLETLRWGYLYPISAKINSLKIGQNTLLKV
ncbi:uncharacterized protein LOC131065602 [Cryptomeria japonica]|uniref:uncharacterized protein LOC131065602 n=1 Tax=Cryptomeria japonica TaxID=3369 RepID=UPI0027DA5912|nr:uncharacterized protein LOC131065602 [Cryptomeria japonica]